VAPSKRSAEAEAASDPPEGLAVRLAGEIAALDGELAEIELLVNQAGTEATRHEQRRAQAAEKLATASNLPPADLATLNAQLVSLTRRASVMEAQVEVLEGKRKTLSRFRERLAELGHEYGAQMPGAGPEALPRLAAGSGASEGEPAAGSPMSRIVLNAQEDLRREIARAMHDGPAQSLTNIVLQAQILDRLLSRDPDGARGELRLLISMVQQTLDATKSFIFDVRPMVLDDLGLVPTLRRAARERGRRAGVSVEFDSVGQDRRIDVDLESSLFRIVDEALSGYLAGRPDRLGIRLDWSEDMVEARITADRDPTKQMADAEQEVAAAAQAVQVSDKDLPPALESMMADRRERAEARSVAAREAAIVALPVSTWREIQQRATTTGILAELSEGGGTLLVRVDLGTVGDEADEPS
jgi:two-component system, NarL family, sensor histidine kinase DegS